MKMYSMPISIMFLAISIFTSAIIISNSLSANVVPASNGSKEMDEKKQLLSKEEITVYLGISIEQFDELDKMQIAYYGEGIPFLEVGGNKYYTVQSIEKWLSDTNHYQTNKLSDF